MVSSSIHRPVKLSNLIKAANLLLLILCFALFSCQDPSKADPPATLIPKKKMISLLVDIHILEANTENTMVNKDSLQPELKVAYEDIYKKHQVTAIKFKEAFSWYEAHPEKLDALYLDVVAELTKQEEQAKAEQSAQNPIERPADTTRADKVEVINR